MAKLHFLVGLLLKSTLVVALDNPLAAEFGYPSGVDVWCGKAYRAANASFEPGGWLEAPKLSAVALLDLSIRPRMNIYTESESYASFIVDAPISYIHGETFVNSTWNKEDHLTSPFTKLFIDVSLNEVGTDLISSRNVTINSTSNEFVFPLSLVTPRLEPYEVVITGAPADGAQFFTATTLLYYLPDRTDGGSVTKVDSLYGGLLVQDYLSNSTTWKPLFPYTYYVSWDLWLSLTIDNLYDFKNKGYNIIHIVPVGGLPNKAFNFTLFETYLDVMDKLELWLMYDMRYSYKNLSSVSSQVDIVKTRKSLLLYYTADEPDGQVDALNATTLTYDLIKSKDPWHPVSLCLNCLNYYFENYTSGSDIIMTDPYPIGVNTSWSTEYDTACNTTYGCCGCDDCNGNFEDITTRLDLYKSYQEYLHLPQKPLWGVPQAFGNDSTFWSRHPTPEEEIAMNMLFINHGAKGIAMWDYPTEPGIMNMTAALSKVLTADNVTSFLLGDFVHELQVVGEERVDASAWVVGDRMLVSVVNKKYVESTDRVSISLPESVRGVSQVLWGTEWEVNNGTLEKSSIEGLEVDILLLDLSV